MADKDSNKKEAYFHKDGRFGTVNYKGVEQFYTRYSDSQWDDFKHNGGQEDEHNFFGGTWEGNGVRKAQEEALDKAKKEYGRRKDINTRIDANAAGVASNKSAIAGMGESSQPDESEFNQGDSGAPGQNSGPPSTQEQSPEHNIFESQYDPKKMADTDHSAEVSELKDHFAEDLDPATEANRAEAKERATVFSLNGYQDDMVKFANQLRHTGIEPEGI